LFYALVIFGHSLTDFGVKRGEEAKKVSFFLWIGKEGMKTASTINLEGYKQYE
jgi:hypothetical protein